MGFTRQSRFDTVLVMRRIERTLRTVAIMLLFLGIPAAFSAGGPFRLNVPRGLDLYVPRPDDNQPGHVGIDRNVSFGVGSECGYQ